MPTVAGLITGVYSQIKYPSLDERALYLVQRSGRSEN